MRSEAEIVLLHGGALGDLVLSIQLGLQICGARARGVLAISRVDPGELSGCRPSIRRISSEILHVHQLFADPAEISPALQSALKGKFVIPRVHLFPVSLLPPPNRSLEIPTAASPMRPVTSKSKVCRRERMTF